MLLTKRHFHPHSQAPACECFTLALRSEARAWERESKQHEPASMTQCVPMPLVPDLLIGNVMGTSNIKEEILHNETPRSKSPDRERNTHRYESGDS